MIQLDDLFGDNKLIHGISQNKIQKCINYYKQNIENKDTNVFNYNYNSIIKRTAILINELNIKNPLDASIVFEYLLWNGYLSKNQKITFSNYDRVINLTALGADIMRGKTVCLNNCDMLCRILRELKYTSHMVACDVNLNQNTNICYKPKIKEKTIEKQKLLKILNMIKKKYSNNGCDEIIEGNHVNSLVFHNNQYFIVDPTNLGLMYFDSFLKAKYYFSSITADILLWPLLALEGVNEKEFNEIINYLNQNLDKNISVITDSLNYMNVSSSVVELCENNLNLINDFYIENINDINSICKTLK